MNRDAKVRVMVGNEVHEFETSRELMINRDDLDTELARQAALYAWYGVLVERARAERMEVEAEIERLEGDVEQEIRASITDKKLMTENAIKAKVKSDPRLIKLGRDARRIERDERFVGVMYSAFFQRKDLVVALARNRNAELSAPSAAEVEKVRKLYAK